ncbi:Gp15 family bacteriophage protein [Ectobacillus antri]|jgi:hypothetical protein|uniref:Gp15 family bacteriophage protein n=1 Tax=Ectobacillus antri TaxID=2486280 RepID=UPI000F58F5A9|nr:Gp15 family bacteriophage protein [Ectobacillus antri]
MSSFLLTSDFDDSFLYKGQVLHVDLSFDNVLRVFELFKDPVFSDGEKIEIALEMLLIEYSSIQHLSTKDLYTLFLYIFKEFLDMDLTQQEEADSQKVYDFEQDAGIIYASFLRAYQMDLFEQHGKLHWQKFLQLLTHLDEKSKFKEVIGYRQMKVPAPDKHNQEYRDHVMRMKRMYRLEQEINEQQALEQLDKKFDNVAAFLKTRG